MLRNFLKIAFRNLFRNKAFSIINITGLAVGMASAILILLWIYNEVSYDKFHANKDNLYAAWNRGKFDGKIHCWDNTPKILGITLKQEYPEVVNISRQYSQWFVTKVGEKKMSTKAMVTDPAFLSMFSFPFIEGNAATALTDAQSIVVTEKMAKKMFGNENALGKIITIDQDHFKVSGILKDLPVNTVFDFEYILPWTYLKKLDADDDYWGNNSVKTFVQLAPGSNTATVNEKIKDITIRHSNHQEDQEVFLHPISKWHLYSNFENGKVVGGRIDIVRLFGIIAVFILLIACINFMNLSTARSEKRAKEVGIRKVSGASKGLLVGQFVGESVVIAFIAGLIALLFVYISLPAFSNLLGKVFEIPLGRPYFWLALVLFITATGIVAGSYPAFFLSSFKPVTVLKGAFKKAHAAVNPRKVLVVLQFTFAIVLIISTIMVARQIRHAQNRNIGYDKDQLVYHWVTGDLPKNFASLKAELLSSGVASSVVRTAGPLTSNWSDTWGIQWQGKDPHDKTDFDRFMQDEGLIKMTGMQLLEGRDLDLVQFPTDSTAMIINESAAKAMKFKNPIGQLVQDNGITYHVVGVIKDFVLGSPYQPTKPMIIEGSKGNYFNVINLKLTSTFSTSESLQKMEQIFRKYNPHYPFEYHFVDEDHELKFRDTQRVATLTGLFAGLTIFISCLGLFGLAAYMAENRIKEIGIRKVLGASVTSITALLSREFLLLVIISILLASPIAWYVVHQWLQGYAYRIDMQWWVFVLAGVLAVLVSLITVSFQAVKAALSNPVKALRTE